MVQKIQQTAQLSNKLQSIEKELQKASSSRSCVRLFHKLDVASIELEKLKSSSFSIFIRENCSYLEKMKEQVQSLYGRITSKRADIEVEKIAEEASHLEKKLESAHPTQISTEIIKLQKHINTVLYNHGLSKNNLKIVANAKKTLQKANQKVKNETMSPIRHFDFLSAQKPSIKWAKDENDEELALELFEIAESVYYREEKTARMKWLMLGEETKARIKKSFPGDNSFLFHDRISTIQALIHTAYFFSGIERGYIDESEIQEIFTDARQVEFQE